MLDAEKLNFIERERLALEELILQATGLRADVTVDIHHPPEWRELQRVAHEELGWILRPIAMQNGQSFMAAFTDPQGSSTGDTTIYGEMPDA
jgi:hypothetical protein